MVAVTPEMKTFKMSPRPKSLPARRQFLKVTGAAGATLLATPAVLRAQEAVLRVSSWLPPDSLIPQNFFDVWIEEVNALMQGRVRLEYLPAPLGPPPAHLELLQSGQADIAYSVHGYTKNGFERAKIGQFSFLGDAFGASHAFSKVYGRLLEAEKEHEGIRLLALFQHGPGVLMLKDRTINSPDDFNGLRVRTAGGYIGDLMNDLGAENVPMSPVAVGGAFDEGRIDAVAFPYEAAPAFGIVDKITSISELPGGYYNASWFLGMSEQAAGRISPEDLEEIRKYSSSVAHVLAAKAFDYADYLGLEAFKAKGTPISVAGDELLSHIKGLAEGYEARWTDTLAAENYDGKRALAYTRRITGGN